MQAFLADKLPCIKPKTQKAIEVKNIVDNVWKGKVQALWRQGQIALNHLRGKHKEIYSREVVSKIKMSDVMKKYYSFDD